MFYDCSDEFDLTEIFQKLTNTVPMVCANKFFERRDELELLQNKMNRIFSETALQG